MHIKPRRGLLMMAAVGFLLFTPAQVDAAYRSTATTICTVRSNVHVRTGPGTNYPIRSTLHRGARVKKIGVNGSWTRVKINRSKYYVKSMYLKKLYKYVYVSGDWVNVRSGPGTNYRIRAILPKNTRLKCTGQTGQWLRVSYKGTTCYINKPLVSNKKTYGHYSSSGQGSHSSVSTQNTASIKSKAIAAARARLGDTYSQSRRNDPGFADCSSLIRDVFLSASGVNVGETTNAQIRTLGAYQKPLSALQAGDVLMKISVGSNHAALYIGNNQYIHASSTKGKVVASTYYPSSSYWTCCYDASAYCSSR